MGKSPEQLERLLLEACDTIAMFWPEQMSHRLAEWYAPKVYQRRQARIRQSEDGVAMAVLHGLGEESSLGWDE